MTDDSGRYPKVQRDLGEVFARLDAQDRRYDKFEERMSSGFDMINEKLDQLFAEKNQRKGEITTWAKIFVGAGTIAGILEAIKAWMHK